MAAAGLADRLVRDPQPLVGGRVGDHVLDQLAVLLLDVGAVTELGARRREAVGDRVADLLELGDAEHTRPAGGGYAPLDPDPRERGPEQPAELGLHAPDLAAQVGARAALLSLGEGRLERRQSIEPESLLELQNRGSLH